LNKNYLVASTLGVAFFPKNLNCPKIAECSSESLKKIRDTATGLLLPIRHPLYIIIVVTNMPDDESNGTYLFVCLSHFIRERGHRFHLRISQQQNRHFNATVAADS
jgi:hypothetical protein